MWKLILRNGPFRTFLLARSVNNAGSMFTYMLFIVLSYQASGNLAMTMGVLLSQTLGNLLMGSVAGVMVDRRSPLWTMMTTYVLLAAMISVLFWLPQRDWLYDIMAFAVAVVSSFGRSASSKYRSW